MVAPRTPAQQQWMTPGEVAAVFRVDPKTVTRWGADGRIPSMKTPGGHRRFRRDVIERLAAFEDPS